MMLPPREPQPGDKITANWARDIVRYMKAITPMPGPGTRIDRKPHGSFITASGGGSGGGGGGSSDNGCWKIVSEEDPSAQPNKTFANTFFSIGGNMYEHAEPFYIIGTAVTPDVDPPEGSEYAEGECPYVFLKVYMKNEDEHKMGDSEVCCCSQLYDGDPSVPGASGESLIELSKNLNFYIKPLYKLTHTGGVAIDFRNMQQIHSMEA